MLTRRAMDVTGEQRDTAGKFSDDHRCPLRRWMRQNFPIILTDDSGLSLNTTVCLSSL